MKLKRVIAAMSVMAMFFTPVYADNSITRGEAADMLLRAADDYTPGLQRSDIIHGYDDGQLHEDKELTRAEALVMFRRAFGEFPEPKGHNLRSGYPASNFTDVPEWAEAEISDVLSSGIVAGTSESTLSPDDIITDEQLERLIKRTYAYMGTNLKDDFWASVNKETLDTLEISEGKVSAGGTYVISDNVDKQMEDLIQKLLDESCEKGSKEQKVTDMYRSVLNTEYRKKTGLTPVEPLIERIENAESLKDIMDINNELSKTSIRDPLYDLLIPCPFIDFYIDVGYDDNSKKVLYIEATDGFLKTKELYEDENTISEYRNLIRTYFTAIGKTEEEAEKCASLVIDYETRTMKHYPTYQESESVKYINNLFTMDEIREMFPEVDIDSVFAASGYDESLKNTPVQLKYVDYAKAVASELTEENLDTLKAYTEFTVMNNFGPMLSDELTAAFEHFNKTTGISTTPSSAEERALYTVEKYMPDYLSEMYVEKYFTAEMKSNVETMANDIIDTYKDRISKLDWMSDKTKEKALLKLDKMEIKIGYPDEFEDILKDAEIQEDSYYENYINIAKAVRQHNIDVQYEPVDKSRFRMPLFIVNAYYDPQFNEIVFPAAILQAPFYDYDASYEANLGGIGYVIAHEITHAFDNTGADYDENGRDNNWWTDKDRAAFDALCDKMEAFYDGQEAAPGIETDGELTLGENIADNGAVACVLEIASKLENPDYDVLFRSAAFSWAVSYTRNRLEYLAVGDPHSNAKLRTNRVFENNQIFYDTYGITEGDGMYVAPENRVKIW